MIKNKNLATSMISKKCDDIAEEYSNKASAILRKYAGQGSAALQLKIELNKIEVEAFEKRINAKLETYLEILSKEGTSITKTVANWLYDRVAESINARYNKQKKDAKEMYKNPFTSRGGSLSAGLNELERWRELRLQKLKNEITIEKGLMSLEHRKETVAEISFINLNFLGIEIKINLISLWRKLRRRMFGRGKL